MYLIHIQSFSIKFRGYFDKFNIYFPPNFVLIKKRATCSTSLHTHTPCAMRHRCNGINITFEYCQSVLIYNY